MIEVNEITHNYKCVIIIVVSIQHIYFNFIYPVYVSCLETVSTIYDMCRYEKAFHFTNISPWCAAFTKNELQVILITSQTVIH